ncbi:MAG: DUF308 domain-containing protein [Gammaproteobacteria bacterium]|nr:DUF308 domain-containing protein [Gammaproteobacteria bacterium]
MNDPQQYSIELDTRIKKMNRAKISFLVLSWLIAIILAVAGVFTATSGISTNMERWWNSPDVIVFWGVLTAICGAVTKVIDPSVRAEKYRLIKRAIQLIKINYEASVGKEDERDLKERAEKLRIKAKESPQEVIEELLKH